MAETVYGVKIVFKTEAEPARYTIAATELRRLVQAFEGSQDKGCGYGIFEVTLDDEPRMLALRFSDVLYIG